MLGVPPPNYKAKGQSARRRSANAMDAPVLAFAAATAEQRTIVMLMERLSVIEDQMLADQRKLARLETRQLISAGTALKFGRRLLWGCNIPAGHHASSGDYVAITDLGSDLVERAIARRGGPLYEHISHGVYDRSDRMEPLASYLKLRGGALGGAEVLFVNDVDVGMLVVKIVDTPLADVVEELHAILEEDDNDAGLLRCAHASIYFNRIGAAAEEIFAGWISGSVPPPAPGKIDDAIITYFTDYGLNHGTKEGREFWDTVYRHRINGNGSTKCN